MRVREFGLAPRRTRLRWFLAGALLATTALIGVPRAEAQSRLDLFPGLGLTDTFHVYALSGNGAYLAGGLLNPNSGLHYATRWSAGGTALDLGSDIGASSHVQALNFDGSVAVGFSNTISMPGAFRWTEADGLTYIGSLGGNRSWAYDVSDDGTVVVGLARRADFQERGYVWIKDATTGVASNPQMHEIPLVAAAGDVAIRGLSGDGRYVIGYELDLASYQRAYRYDVGAITTGAVGHVEIGDLGTPDTLPDGISDDGRVIVGYSRLAPADGGYLRAFRWVEGATGGTPANPQMADLGTLGGTASSATDVSGDGRVVVGNAEDAAFTWHAFRWSEETGMLSVADWLRQAGVSVASDLAEATATSRDGSIVTGTTWDANGERIAYLARVIASSGPGPSPGNGIMDVAQYQKSLFSAASVANSGELLSWLPLNGAHHRPLMLTPSLSGDVCAWATGDFAHHGATDTALGLAETGLCVDLLGGGLRLGAGVGTTHAWQDFALGGSSRMAGQYVLGEADWQPDGTPLLLSVTGMLGGWDVGITRAYTNGAALVASHGDTQAWGGVVRLRADWLEAGRLGNTSFNPFASVALGRLHLDGFVETGGPFPARFDAQSLSTKDIRLGLTAITDFSAQTKLSTTLELAHRTGTAPHAAGQVQGLFAFDLGGGTYANSWVRLGAELDHALTDGVAISLSAHAATNGRDPTIAGSLSLKGAL